MTLRALIFDVDGTLYRQDVVRRKMLLQLATTCARSPREGYRVMRILAAYRRAHESLRAAGDVRKLRETQMALAARWTGMEPFMVESVTRTWMEQRPLDLLRAAMRPGCADLLAESTRRGLRLGVLSDYPAEEKLEAMGIRPMFDAVVCAQDPEVDCLKPNPKGLEMVMQRLGVKKQETLYIGDRREVDQTVAARAGMACVILGKRDRVAGLEELLSCIRR